MTRVQNLEEPHGGLEVKQLDIKPLIKDNMK